MAINTTTTVMIVGTASATPALAASTYNTAVATLYAGGGTIYNNLVSPVPTCLTCGMAVAQDAAVANAKYTCWGQFSYYSAS